MDMRALARPAAELLTRAKCQTPVSLPIISTRGHKTTARTKRALRLAPHDSFLPARTPNASTPSTSSPSSTGSGNTSIIFNPPASEASPLHTPFLFLPPEDPRRTAILRMRSTHNLGANSFLPSTTSSDFDLPPEMKYPRRQARYNLSAADMAEMRRLRAEDPVEWSVNSLAAKFNCSPIIVRIAAPPPAGHHQWLQEKLEKKKARWGPMKRKAREEREMRTEMLYRGEL